MILEIVDVAEHDDSIEVRAIIERIASSWDPQDEYVYTQECAARLSPEDVPTALSDSELLAVLNQLDLEWEPIQ